MGLLNILQITAEMPVYTWLRLKAQDKTHAAVTSMQKKKKSLLAAAHSSLNGWNKFSYQIKRPLLLRTTADM